MASQRHFSTAFALGIALACWIHCPAACFPQGSEPGVDALGCPTQTIFPKLVMSVLVSCDKADSAEVPMPLTPDARGVYREKSVRGIYEFREYQIQQTDQQERGFQNLVQLAPMAGFKVKYSDNISTITAPNGETWVLVKVSGEYYDVKTVKAKDDPWIPIQNAQEISREMESHKRVAIYGIAFSPDNRAVVEEKSKILAEVLKYLKGNPGVAVNVESHKMSDTGTAQGDEEITSKRAKAVVDWLMSHGIARARLMPKALGRNNPITENDTLLEIQQNDRIELSRTAP